MTMDQVVVNVVIPAVKIAVVLGIVSGGVAYLTLLERKVLGFMQLRLAPRRVGPRGLLQPIADGIKLLLKEDVMPQGADRALFLLAPVLAIIPAFASLAVLPFASEPFTIFGYTITPYITDVNIGVLYILSITSLGSLRSAAQMISYEVPLGLSIIGVLMLSGTASMVGIVEAQRNAGLWFFVPQIVGLFCFFVAAVAETNRLPFDLPEAEAELVAGYQTEYAGMKFAFFMMAEYTAMIVVASVCTTLWLGGWMRPFPNIEGLAFLDWLNFIHPALSGVFWFAMKALFVLYVYIWLRGTFPRYRYDQLMRIGWKWLLPLSLLNVLATGVWLVLR